MGLPLHGERDRFSIDGSVKAGIFDNNAEQTTLDFPNLVLCKHLASIATPPRFITEPPSAWSIRFRNHDVAPGR